MMKLKNIIGKLEGDTVTRIEESFKKNKADHFLYLFQSYKNGAVQDKEIIEKLDITPNSFYVLKSRLMDKIRETLVGDNHSREEELFSLLHNIPDMCLNHSKEVSTAYLEKLEEDLLHYNMHHELLQVYSALKRNHIFSEKYFHYSQQYNKHMAFSMSLEKSEEILGNFNRELGLYLFSRSEKSLATLQFLKKSVHDHLVLSASIQIQLISILLEVQLEIFCETTEHSNEKSTEEKIRQMDGILKNLPASSQYKSWSPVVDYLFFEYYFKSGNTKAASNHYDKLIPGLKSLFLYTGLCCSSRFLLSQISYCRQSGRLNEFTEQDQSAFLFDPNDVVSKIYAGISRALQAYHRGNFRESALELNRILNENSFKDFFHVNTEIRLALAYIYILGKDQLLAENQIKSIQRKIKNDKIAGYDHVLDLIKVFSYDLKPKQTSGKMKQRDHFTLFMARNKGPRRLLGFLEPEMEKRYTL